MSDPIRDRIERTLLSHRLQHQVIDGSDYDHLPLLDALSTGDDVSTGRNELELLADEIAGDLEEVLSAPLPEPDYETGGAPTSPQSDTPAEEPRGGAAGEGERYWCRGCGANLLRDDLCSVDPNGHTRTRDRRGGPEPVHCGPVVPLFLPSSPTSSLPGELARVRGALERIAHGAPTGHPYATPEETLAEKVQIAEVALVSGTGESIAVAIRAAIKVRGLRRRWRDKIVLTDEEHEAGYGRAVRDLDAAVDALLAAHPEIRGEVEGG